MGHLTLYVVSTPIGNLSDITERAAATLRSVGMVICEDTRQTGKLLHHLHITTRMTAVHEHNERRRLSGLLSYLADHDAALVSDAGTPTISDPGFALVRACRKNGIAVVPIPGANAAVAALAASGFATDAFHFAGFLPKHDARRRASLERLLDEDCTVVLYESPYRIRKTLDAIDALAPEREVCLAHELTKLHESFLFGTAAEIEASCINPRGEFVVLINKPTSMHRRAGSTGERKQKNI